MVKKAELTITLKFSGECPFSEDTVKEIIHDLILENFNPEEVEDYTLEFKGD